MAHQARTRQAGFTLAEAAITIALVALTLSVMLQILQGTKFTTAHTRATRIARSMALQTIGEIESGQRWDDIEFLHSGSYGDYGYPEFTFDVALGDEGLPEYDDEADGRPFDNWAEREERERELADERDENEDDEELEPTEPFEKVRVRVTFPRFGDLPSELVLERWIPWEQVYGREEEEEEEDAEAAGAKDDSPAGKAGQGAEDDDGG